MKNLTVILLLALISAASALRFNNHQQNNGVVSTLTLNDLSDASFDSSSKTVSIAAIPTIATPIASSSVAFAVADES
jgi:hypothetical protein